MARNMCLNPVYLADKGMRVPCGHCRACRLKLRSEWSLRVKHEMERYKGRALFVTLTYDNKHIPADGGLSVRDIQLYHKRLRKQGLRFSYYLCGEYGPKTMRPHYHAIYIGLTMTNAKMLFDTWGKCQPQAFRCEAVSSDRQIAYATGYTAKKLGAYYNKKFIKEHNIKPPFQVQSIGIGKQWCLTHAKEFRDGKLNWRGKQIVPPRYYRKLMDFTAEYYIQDIEDGNRNQVFQIIDSNPDKVLILAESPPVKSRYYYGGYIVTQEFFRILQTHRDQCDAILKQKEKDWRSKL